MPIHMLCIGDTGAAEPVKVRRITIPNGNAGILISAKHLLGMIEEFQGNQERIRFLAEDITRSCRSKDYLCNAERIYNWVKDNIKWDRDPLRKEQIRSPITTLDRGVGDCDDHTVLLGSLLESMGIPTRIVLAATRRNVPDNFNHVFVEALVPVTKNGVTKNTWAPMDTTPLNVQGERFPFGVLPPAYTYKRMGV